MTASEKKDQAEKPLTPVMEDYLETIYNLDVSNKVVRVKDIAQRMDVKMPTVSSMLKTLNSRGLVDYEKYEYVRLTKDGADVGREMHRRHLVLHRFLTEVLKIDHDTADGEACKMEHALGSETLDSLVDFMEFIQACPRAGETWLSFFEEYRSHGLKPDKCTERCPEFSHEYKCRLDAL
ncbi:hypothetical protein JCM14469_07920 [Desulfatiferula olefinivorans]